MSIQKFNDDSQLQQDVVPYTQINTQILQSIKDLNAGFVWVYLLSLPRGWKVIKQQIKNHFKIGDLKIKKIFAYLNAHNLIEYIQVRDELGKKIIRWDIRVLNGSKFVDHENEEEKTVKKQKVKKKSYPQPTGSKVDPLDNHPGRESRAIKQIQSYKENKDIKKTVTASFKNVKAEKQKSKPKEQKQKKFIEGNFYPNHKNQQLADHVAMKCQTSGAWLIRRFIHITTESGRKEYDFNDLFTDFLEKQRPSKDLRANSQVMQASKYF